MNEGVKWLTMREAAAITGRSVAALHQHMRRGNLRAQRVTLPSGREGFVLHPEDVETLRARRKQPHKRVVPEPCESCAWRLERRCAVFTEVLPAGWRTPAGGCQAYADEPQMAAVLQAIQAYAVRMNERMTA